MSDEELIETLRAFEKNRVEQLDINAQNLFYAIMRIADERDELKERNIKLYKKDTKIILDLQNKINKTIEYIENEMPYLFEVDNVYENMNGKDYCTYKEYNYKILINLLNGSDKE